MGVTITTHHSKDQLNWSYSIILQIRALALLVAGYKPEPVCPYLTPITEYIKYYDSPVWEKYPDFYQLLHFHDYNAILVPEDLIDINIKSSFKIGNMTKLYDELIVIKKAITKNTEKFSKYPDTVRCFFEFYSIVKKELNENGIIFFD